MSSDSLLEDMKCCDTSKEMLFVMLRKTAEIPPFDTRFVNYGFNRQEWTEHLRSQGLFVQGVPRRLFGGGSARDVGEERE